MSQLEHAADVLTGSVFSRFSSEICVVMFHVLCTTLEKHALCMASLF